MRAAIKPGHERDAAVGSTGSSRSVPPWPAISALKARHGHTAWARAPIAGSGDRGAAFGIARTSAVPADRRLGAVAHLTASGVETSTNGVDVAAGVAGRRPRQARLHLVELEVERVAHAGLVDETEARSHVVNGVRRAGGALIVSSPVIGSIIARRPFAVRRSWSGVACRTNPTHRRRQPRFLQVARDPALLTGLSALGADRAGELSARTLRQGR